MLVYKRVGNSNNIFPPRCRKDLQLPILKQYSKYLGGLNCPLTKLLLISKSDKTKS